MRANSATIAPQISCHLRRRGARSLRSTTRTTPGFRASEPCPRLPSPFSDTLRPVRVVIADDHRLVLDGIRRALEADGDFDIVGETQSGTQVLPLVGRTKPDLVLLDVRMPQMDGLACLDEIRRRHPEIKVVMLSASTSNELVEAALRRGASAYIVKTVNPDDLPATLRQALEGNIHTALGMDEERSGAK